MYRVNRRFSWAAGAAALAFLLLLAAFQSWYLDRRVVADGRAVLRLVLSEAQAVHQYCTTELRPAVQRVAPPGAFVPEAMSGVFATGRVMRLFTTANPGYTYKFAALAPRNPANLADAAEAAMIRRFAAEPGLTAWEGTATRGGEKIGRAHV
jgi:hypothetical protein